MQKIILTVSLVTVIAVAALGVSYIAIKVNNESQSEESKELANKPVKFDKQQMVISGEKRTDLPKLIDGNEPQVTEIMHKMTHQKVLAHDKWGAIEMTAENITRIKEHVLANEFKSEKFF